MKDMANLVFVELLNETHENISRMERRAQESDDEELLQTANNARDLAHRAEAIFQSGDWSGADAKLEESRKLVSVE